MIGTLILSTVFAAPCVLDVPPETPFAVKGPTAAGGARLVVVVRATDSNQAAVQGVFDVLDARGLPGTLSIRADLPEDWTDQAVSLREAGHTMAARVPTTQMSSNTDTGPRRLRKAIKPLSSATGKVRVIEAGLGNKGVEAVLHRIGLRAVLETNGPASATPRRQQTLEGQPDNGVILPAGPYAGSCGTSPIASPFTPASADRVTQALYGARTSALGVVRVTLTPTDPQEATVLANWLDQIVLPAQIPVLSPLALRELALPLIRLGTVGEAKPMLGGRLVTTTQVGHAARDLQGATAIARDLSGTMNPTEAFQAFMLLLIGRNEAEVVRLADLEGPKQLTPSVLTGPVDVDRQAVVDLATALADELPTSIPTAMSVDGHLFTAPELLLLFASAVRGDARPVTHPVTVPQPGVPGLGWGRAEPR